MQTSVVNAQPHSYLPAPAPGVIPDPDPKRFFSVFFVLVILTRKIKDTIGMMKIMRPL